MSERAEIPLEELFTPSSVAVIGASTGRESLGGRIIGYLDDNDYAGTVYPVNPKYDSLHGRECYGSILDIADPPTAAFVMLPAPLVIDAVRECGEAGVDYVIIGSSGFGETGRDDSEQELKAIADEYDMRILGPNSEGVINTPEQIALSFSSVCRLDLEADGLAVVSQSGGMGGAFLQIAAHAGVGTRKWVTTGNEADLSLLDILENYVEDPEVSFVVTLVEAVGDGRRLFEIGQRALETGTPILTLKIGDSDLGKQATQSHTGRMSDSGEVYEAALRETGIVQLNSVQDYVDALEAFSTLDMPQFPDGPGLSVISASGGSCALIADACEEYGVDLPSLPDDVREQISEHLPEYGSASNPIDMTGKIMTDLDLLDTLAGSVIRSPSVDAMLLQVGNTGPEYVRPARETIYELIAETGKPIVVVFTGGWPDEELLADLHAHGVPVYQDPVTAVREIGHLAEWTERRRNPPPLAAEVPTAGDLSLQGGWEELATEATERGVDVVPYRLTQSVDGTVDAAEALGYPVTVKLSAPGLKHKTELGGVRTDRRTEREVRAAADDLLSTAEREGLTEASLLIQEQVDGFELVCGFLDTAEFGPVMLVGPGGEYVELFDETARETVFLPTEREYLRDRLTGGRLGHILDNNRRHDLSVDALVDTLEGLAAFYIDSGESEFEVNPVVLTDERAVVVDLLAE
ncbi:MULTISPECIES: acetate--CoA ligase family protein [Salinibaculum]|uniref:acetate--CoA ligase family protein n=1 Tax=Salinibaculum TaxID=2732368 RepID=UPI0030CE5F57